MNIAINKSVSYAVASVSIKNLILMKDGTGALTVSVPFAWLDSTNKIIRNGNNKYTAAQLTAAFTAQGQDFAPIGTALISLIPTGTQGNCNLILGDTEMTAVQGYAGTVEEKPQWISTLLTNANLVTAIAPVTTAQLTAMITAFVAAVTQ